jgi:multidrug resistance efflux pump
MQPYDFVPMGAELLHVADLKRMEIQAFFDEPDIGELAVGQPVRIVWDARPEDLWTGHIKRAPLAAMPLARAMLPIPLFPSTTPKATCCRIQTSP